MPDFSLVGDDHVRRYEETGGAVGHDWNGVSCLILRTTGRQSGELRRSALIYGRAGDDLVVVASKNGDPEDPGWYRNLLAQPRAEVQVRDEVRAVEARTASGDERRELWQLMLAEWPYYERYQARTERQIPVVVLSPVR